MFDARADWDALFLSSIANAPRHDEIEAWLKWSHLPYRKLSDIAGQTADLLAHGQIIGCFQGRLEFGPRALGARSIVASPIEPNRQTKLNQIKSREDFRPVAPGVMAEHAAEWFEGFERIHESPFMLFVFAVNKERAARIPAVRHIDGTARVQTLNNQQHPLQA